MNQTEEIFLFEQEIRDHSLQCFIMSLVAMNDIHLSIFHQMISISDCSCKLGHIACFLKLIKVILINLTNFACIILNLHVKYCNFFSYF